MGQAETREATPKEAERCAQRVTANPKASMPAAGVTPFLALLEARTQQLKTAIANLKDDTVRIDALIAKLEPLVPHYDALISAERSLVRTGVDLDPAAPTGD
jgi:hypothetical protein